jgi:protein-L-isoaspartate(D-aspartate) O-methyltransferase
MNELQQAPGPDRLATARRRMVQQQILARGVREPDVLTAMRTVPRHRFVPEHVRAESAYADHALPIGPKQTISQPYIVARMTELVIEDGGLRGTALEVGTGSGYQAAVLAELFGHVVTIERDPELADVARQRLRELHYRNVEVHAADGREGWPEVAPYDAILVTAGLEKVPEALFAQLRPDTGRLVAPVGPAVEQLQLRIYRAGPKGAKPTHEDVLPVRFVPLI